jgi:biotin operon repressor
LRSLPIQDAIIAVASVAHKGYRIKPKPKIQTSDKTQKDDGATFLYGAYQHNA